MRQNNNNKNNQNKSYITITAPYNFVPLNKEIFYPDWAKNISHDVPFRDGESGEIDIKITAKSPIFIRNHYVIGDDFYKVEKDGKIIQISKEFCHHKNRDGRKEFYIPSTSVKGMARSIVEILSFSRIKIDNNRFSKPFSVRDMSVKNDKKNFILAGSALHCGFLVTTQNGYELQDCGNIITVSYEELKKIGIDTKDLESAKEKYEKYGLLKEIKFNTKKNKNTIAILNGKDKGTLVFTGSIYDKKNEFIFKNPDDKLSISEAIFNDFKAVYFDNKDSIDGQFWKNKFSQTKKIPVFYKKEDNQEIVAIGLTQLFKILYKKSILQASAQIGDIKKIDLAESIFGTVRDGIALKGRVYFSHFKSTSENIEEEKEEILGSPNPSYYPNYIEQNTIKGILENYTTLMDNNAVIRGRKRYPLQNTTQKSFIPKDKNGKGNHDVTTKFKPLPKETEFRGKLKFHNLKKAEIGALLSALTFHGNNELLHNIGMAKPLGYGKIQILLDFKNSNLECSQDEYLKEFENLMNKWRTLDYSTGWKNSKQVRELFAIHNDKNSKSLTYQKLDPNSKINEFISAKAKKLYLKPYSQG